MKPALIAGCALSMFLMGGQAFAQATPPLDPRPTTPSTGKLPNDRGTVGMGPSSRTTPRANRNTGTGGPNTTGSGNDNMLYVEPGPRPRPRR